MTENQESERWEDWLTVGALLQVLELVRGELALRLAHGSGGDGVSSGGVGVNYDC